MRIEVSFVGLDNVRRRMGIRNKTGQLLERKGVEISSLNEIDVDPQNGRTLTYKNHIVVVYIRDQYAEYLGEYKVHVSNCRTLRFMKAQGRYNRYVLSTRTDGTFRVYDRSRRRDRFVKLDVCENCLKELNWKGCRSSYDMKKFVHEFSLEEFFKRYDEYYVPELPSEPLSSDVGAPTNNYSPSRLFESMQGKSGMEM